MSLVTSYVSPNEQFSLFRLQFRTSNKLDMLADRDKGNADYVIRRFNASSAGLSLLVGLDLRWDTA